MSSKIPSVTEESFEAEVLKADVPVLLDFGASWCGPCRTLEPVMEKIASENVGKLKVRYVDTDEAPRIAARYGVRGVPTIVAFKNGVEHKRHVGATTAGRILELLT